MSGRSSRPEPMTVWRGVVVLAALAEVWASRVAHAQCVETAPKATGRPEITDTFPDRSMSGYAATLHIVVSHGRGETVLPRALELKSESEAARALKAAGFELPDQDGGSAVRLSRADAGGSKAVRLQTTLDVPLVALPREPGRHSLTLPALPVAIARANGDVVTLCTKEHSLVVEDPIASTPNARPRPNPQPRAQREEWTALERALGWGLVGTAAGALVAWAIAWWRKRPKPLPPPPPPRIPWELALERLDEVRHAGLLETRRFSEFFDRVNDAIREYLGARFGFDGLESTTDETIAALRRIPHFSSSLVEIVGFLQQCDLVKFADYMPTVEECQHTLGEAERIVRGTMPRAPARATGALS
ncbi:MAG TPA: hypothetical protein VEK07_11050 [Polyangiaceae bacterium]|nr:hypothetical protein [Polyangiaceae bacterium]